MTSGTYLETSVLDWQARLDHVVETVRELSLEADPQKMVRAYARRMRELFPLDGNVAISRRGLRPPYYRITRSHLWDGQDINPWKQPEKLPLLDRGILGELIYSDRPQIIDELAAPADDPAYEHLAGMRSAIAVPHYSQGVALNMVVHLRREAGAFSREAFAELVLMSNLFGRATHNLVLAEQLRTAYEAIDAELAVVADIQRSLLPVQLPPIPGLELAAFYQTSRRAGGDYYDFFPLPDGRWGILIADVSGHGTPAAVVMAITHAIAHSLPGPPAPPEFLLDYINGKLTERQKYDASAFVTAFYGVYDPATRQLTYASAGHPPPRLRRCDGGTRIIGLDAAQHLPLGIVAGEQYTQATLSLECGDCLLLYTDGISEAHNPLVAGRDLFGVERLDAALLDHDGGAQGLIDGVLAAVEAFTGGQPPADDRTLLAACIS